MIDEPDIPIPERRLAQAPTAPPNNPPAPVYPLPVYNQVSCNVAQGSTSGLTTALPRFIFGKARNRPAPQPRRRGAQTEIYLPPLTSIQASPTEGPEKVEYNIHKHARMAHPAHRRLFQGKPRAKETTISDSVGA